MASVLSLAARSLAREKKNVDSNCTGSRDAAERACVLCSLCLDGQVNLKQTNTPPHSHHLQKPPSVLVSCQYIAPLLDSRPAHTIAPLAPSHGQAACRHRHHCTPLSEYAPSHTPKGNLSVRGHVQGVDEVSVLSERVPHSPSHPRIQHLSRQHTGARANRTWIRLSAPAVTTALSTTWIAPTCTALLTQHHTPHTAPALPSSTCSGRL